MIAVATRRELSREEQLERVWALAEEALAAYGLEQARLKLLEQKKNVTFRVDEPVDGAAPRRYVMRVCEIGAGGYDEREIRSELQYLLALHRETGLEVPLPVAARDGALVVRGEVEGLPPRYCALFRWVPGRMVEDSPTPQLLERVGELSARIHRFSESFVPPPGFSRPRWDADRLFGHGQVLAPGQGEPLVSDRGRDLLDAAAQAVREEMAALGEDRDVFGLIHKDLEPDNTLVDGDEVHAIDFADLGWGHYLYDMAASLLPLREKQGFAAMRDAFLRGYRRVRTLRQEHASLLETFLIARSIFAVRLMTGKLWDLPRIREYANTAVPQILGGVRLYVEQRRGRDSGGGVTAEATGATRTTVQFLAHLRARGLRLRAEGELLRLSAPPGAMSPALAAELKDRKHEILSFLRQGHVARRSSAPSRVVTPEMDRIPLSFAQQRLWFIDRLFPGSPEYNIARAVRLVGSVRLAVLAASLGEVVRRHSALRTTFAEVDGQPVQHIAPDLAVPLPLIDLQALPRELREPEAWRVALGDARRPFDLGRGPLLRVMLLRLAETDHIAPSTMHHIVGDGWSSTALFREMGVLYTAFVRGELSPLPELPLQYADFAVWQRQWLQGEVLAEQLAYWRDQLAGAPQLALPADRPRSLLRSAEGDRQPLLVPPALAGALRSFAQAQGATMFMILLAAFKALLARYSGQDDIVVGSPIANRNRTEIEGLIGFFANTLVLRTPLPGDPTFRDILAAVRKTTLGAYAHQDLPFEKIVEELRPERSNGEIPFFQVVFTLQNVPYPDMQVADFRMTLMPPTSRAAMFDLTCNMKEMPEGVRTSFMYKVGLFDAVTVSRLADHYLRLLTAVAAEPSLRLGELPLLAPAERHQVLAEWNETTHFAAPLCLHELFAARAAARPGAIAATCGEESVTYRELDARANRLAHRLRSLGVGPEVLVGLCIERSLDMVVAILGVLKAGGAYLPLDPAYPKERLAFVLADARPPVLVTQERLVGVLPESAARTLCLDAASEALDRESDAKPAAGVAADSLAYVIYTSGSTGRPKGSLITHRNAVRLFAATDAWFGFGREEDEVWTLFHSYAFDFSVWELWGALLYGGRLVVVPYWVSRSPADFYALLLRAGVTVLNQTPSAFRQLLRAAEEAAPEATSRLRLRTVIFGGEALDVAALEPWLARHGDRRPRLINMYGITETTVHVSYRPVSREDLRQPWRSPIGIPIPDLRVYVLDRHRNPAPSGVPGEMYVAGAGLGRGYLGRPDLTAERFVPDPFSGAAGGERAYRTGDLARYTGNGGIEYLGRIDHQVKIRGFRIELGEIEAALARQPAVGAALVLVHEDAPDDRRLIAYVVPRAGAALEPAELRAGLRETLPDYMLPAAVIRVDSFPLNANGKVDRHALVRLALDPPAAAADKDTPRGPVEELLAGIWAAMLRVDAVGRQDDFFALGGHSLLATQVVSRIRDTFGVELPLQRLFEEPTIAALATDIAAARRSPQAQEAPPIVPVPREGALPLSFAQQRLWFLDRFEPGTAVYNIPLAVRLTGRLDAGRLAAACCEVARRHEALRTTFAARDGRPVQVIAATPGLDLPLADLRTLSAARRTAEARRLAAAEARRPFDLAAGPLARATLLRLAEEEHAALVTFHHIVADGWSMGIFLNELAALYGAFTRGEPSPLPALPVQYADFADWQRRWLAGGVLAEEIAYWRQQLGGAPRSLQLPTDRPRPAAQTYRGGRLAVTVPRDLATSLVRLGRQEGVTLFMTVLAAFQVLLGRLACSADVAVGTPIAGRQRREIEELIGLFVNTLVLRTDLGGDPTLRELLARVRRVALDGYAHQNIPFERLVEELQPERDLSFNPLFQVMLALQNPPRGALTLPGLRLETLAGAGATAKFDLTLSFQEAEDGLHGTWEQNADLFDAVTVERWWGSFAVLLTGMVEEPARRLSDLHWLGAAERHQVLVDWAATGSTGAEDLCLHQLIEAQAVRTPEAVAVVRGARALTYRELDRQAGRLAARLRALGVGPDERVGVCLERDLDLVVALCAVLKAGGAYVPLDPAYPAERLTFMMEDAAARVLVTSGALLPRFPTLAAAALCLDDGGLTEEAPAVTVPSGVVPGHLAYVIYTSGSTGRPKGVGIEHRSAVALVRWARGVFPPADLDGVLASTSVCFDLSIFELFVPLACGGSVILAENALELASLGPLHGDAQVRLINTVPSAIAELVRQDALPPSVRTVNLAGEALQGKLVERIYRRLTIRRVFNLYGPSEDTTYSTWALVQRGGGEPTIGRPITGTQGYVLDGRLEPVPVGVPGELWLGGEGLSRGYLGRPELTAASYVPDPFGGLPGARLYATGDLVRWLGTGDLQYLGRADHQVKVRGYRIELGEVEAALGRSPGVSDAAVLVREDRPGDTRMVAYVAMKEGPRRNAAELREALREKLPEFMVPAAFVFLDALPLTPNGKLDRRALSRLAPESAAVPAAADGPRDATEELLAGIWAEVLGCERVVPDDNFFALGGHSLLAMQVVSRVRELFAVELPVQRLFAAPTLAGLAALVRAAAWTGEAADAPIPRAARTGELPLSFAQQRLWFFDRLQPGSAAYNVPAAMRLCGPLRPALLAGVFAAVVHRHEVLHTTFAAGEKGPVQVVVPPPSRWPLPVVDLSALPEAPRGGEARRLAAAAAQRSFDLGSGPLLFTSLVRLAETDHVALVTLHHIVADGWSVGVLWRELSALAAAFARGERSPLPPLPIQYADFACWQRDRLSGERLEAEIAHWRERLAGMPRSLALPLDHPRPAVQRSTGNVCRVGLPRPLRDELAALGRRAGATLFMVLLAAFQTLLGRFCAQDDFAVGTPVAGRDRREIEGLIGFFVNLLTLRADLSADPDFRTLLTRVRGAALDAYVHQELPFERLVEELQPVRDLSQSPLFQVVFTLTGAPLPQLDLPDLTLEPVQTASGAAKFDLTLEVRDDATGLSASFEYNTALFNRETILRIMSCYETLLTQVAGLPDRPIGDLPLLSETDLRQVLVEGSGATIAAAELACVHRQVESWAASTPEAPALVHGESVLTYRELNAYSNRLARRLRALGVGVEVPVAVCLPRSAQEVAALLAVLKAGGAYLPLDPAYPSERLAFLVEDAGAAVLISESGIALPPTPAFPLCLDREAPVLASLSGEDLADGAELDHLAYVIYTSGSTGRPKGVAVEHRSLAGLLAWHQRAFAVGPRDRATHLSGLTFDAAVWELWPYLAAGAAVHIPDAAARTSAVALRDWLLASGITATFVPTPIAEGLLPLEWPDGVALRLLLTGGDELHHAPRQRLPFRLINNYGPTEGTVVSTSGEVAAAAAGRPSIGRPIDGVRSILVDRWLQPVPPAAIGEVCIAGHLARGYRGRPDLTAEKLVPDPFGEPGSRLYRTGDQARWLPGGELRFLGRIDGQVKVRGCRIELGEIETVLASHPQVRECAVALRGEPAGDRRLTAYVVGEGAPAAELRAFLAGKLPEFMIPAAWVRLAALPLTPHGKVDRAALPAPERGDLGRDYTAPRDICELRLARIWEELLGVEPVGIHDDFFAMGGHSLLAVRLMARIRGELGRDLPLTVLFQCPTVERLAVLVRRGGEERRRPALVAIQPCGSRPPLFCVHPVGGNVLCYLELARRLGPEQPVYGLQIPEPGARLSIAAMADFYLQALRAADPVGPYRLAGWSLGGVVAFEMARRLGPDGVDLLALLDPSAPASGGAARLAGPSNAGVELFARDLAALAGVPPPALDLGGLAEGEALRRVLAWAHADGLLPAGLDLPLLSEHYAMFRGNLEALAGYTPEPYAGRLVLVQAVERPASEGDEPAAVWSGLAAAVRVLRVPGSHYALLTRPHVERVADLLGPLLDRTVPPPAE